MIYGDKIYKLVREHATDDSNMAVLHFILGDDTIDESSGRLDAEDEKGKSIDLMYGATDAHKNVIRIKSSAKNNFTNKSEFSELFFKYNKKEYDAKGIRKMPSNESKFVLGFVSRYEDPLDQNARSGITTDQLTDLINDDMEQFRLNSPDAKIPKYSTPTGKVELVWNGNIPSFVESKDKPSNYILKKKK